MLTTDWQKERALFRYILQGPTLPPSIFPTSVQLVAVRKDISGHRARVVSYLVLLKCDVPPTAAVWL